MGALSTLTSGTAPQQIQTSSATTNGLPSWYNTFDQGIATDAMAAGNNPYPVYGGQEIAPMTADQNTGISQIMSSSNPGVYSGDLSAEGSTLGQASSGLSAGVGSATNYGQQAVNSVSPNAQSWGGNSAAQQSYMSPYTSSVVNSIGQLGQQNFNQQIAPFIQDNMIANGGAGSTRNMDELGMYANQNAQNTLGQQSSALQSGYTGAETQFNADQAREQGQQTLAANTNLGAASAANTGAQISGYGGSMIGQAQGALGSLSQQLGEQGGQAEYNAGTQQQDLQQANDTTNYNQFMAQAQYPWTQIDNMANVVGALPMTSTQQTSSSGVSPVGYGASPLSQLGAAAGGLSSLYNGISGTNSSTSTATGSANDPSGWGAAESWDKDGGAVGKKAKGGALRALG